MLLLRKYDGAIFVASGMRRKKRRWRWTANKIPLVRRSVGTTLRGSVNCAQSVALRMEFQSLLGLLGADEEMVVLDAEEEAAGC